MAVVPRQSAAPADLSSRSVDQAWHGVPGTPRRRFRCIRQFILATLVVVLLAAPAVANTNTGCRTQACTARVKDRQLERHYQLVWRAAPAAMRAHLRRIAWCESTNNERAISPDGRFRGLLQFWTPTWQTVGGRGDPAAATRWEQWARGVRLYRARGPQPWPVCRNA